MLISLWFQLVHKPTSRKYNKMIKQQRKLKVPFQSNSILFCNGRHVVNISNKTNELST